MFVDNVIIKNYQEGKILPQDFYTNENIFSEEMKRIYFQKFNWSMVDHVTRIPNPGDYFLFNVESDDLLRDPFFIGLSIATAFIVLTGVIVALRTRKNDSADG